MSEIKSFRDLIVWQKSMTLTQTVYRLTKLFPKDEIYGLTNQVRRCSVSISSNIAEGYGRGTSPEYSHFLKISRGSLCELQTQIELAMNFEYITVHQFRQVEDQAIEISKMLNAIIKKLDHR